MGGVTRRIKGINQTRVCVCVWVGEGGGVGEAKMGMEEDIRTGREESPERLDGGRGRERVCEIEKEN